MKLPIVLGSTLALALLGLGCNGSGKIYDTLRPLPENNTNMTVPITVTAASSGNNSLALAGPHPVGTIVGHIIDITGCSSGTTATITFPDNSVSLPSEDTNCEAELTSFTEEQTMADGTVFQAIFTPKPTSPNFAIGSTIVYEVDETTLPDAIKTDPNRIPETRSITVTDNIAAVVVNSTGISFVVAQVPEGGGGSFTFDPMATIATSVSKAIAGDTPPYRIVTTIDPVVGYDNPTPPVIKIHELAYGTTPTGDHAKLIVQLECLPLAAGASAAETDYHDAMCTDEDVIEDIQYAIAPVRNGGELINLEYAKDMFTGDYDRPRYQVKKLETDDDTTPITIMTEEFFASSPLTGNSEMMLVLKAPDGDHSITPGIDSYIYFRISLIKTTPTP